MCMVEDSSFWRIKEERIKKKEEYAGTGDGPAGPELQWDQGYALPANGRWACMAVAVACAFGVVMTFGSAAMVFPLVISFVCVMLFFMRSYTSIIDDRLGLFRWSSGWGSPVIGKQRSFLDYRCAVIRKVTVVKNMRVGGSTVQLNHRQDREIVEGLFVYQGNDRFILLEASPKECIDFYKKHIQPHGLKLYNGSPIPRQEMRV